MSTASRVGRKPVTIPSGVDVKVVNHDLSIKGPKGHCVLPIHRYTEVVIEDGAIKVKTNSKRTYTRSGTGKRLLNSIPGTVRAKINNAIHGVTKGFERKLVLVGVGYRAQIKGKTLNLTLGYSHPIDFVAPDGITIETPSLTEITVKGIDKDLVGYTASKIRSFRGPEPYKGKGVRYADEKVDRKETKKK